MTQQTDYLSLISNLDILSSDSIYEILSSLKKLSDEKYDEVLPYFMDVLLYLAENTEHDFKALKDIYFMFEVFRPERNEQLKVSEFIRKISELIPNSENVLTMKTYPNFESVVYAIHDGSPIFQILKNPNGNFDAFYYLGQTDKQETHYAFTSFDEETLNLFNNSELTLFDLYKPHNTRFYFQPYGSLHYESLDVDLDFDDIFSKEVTASFFASVWGDAWESTHFPLD